jgi:hypothetical protein
MVIDKLKYLKFKRGDIFENKDIYLKNDSMYISKDFAILMDTEYKLHAAITLAENTKKERYFLINKFTVRDGYSIILITIYLYTNILSTNIKIRDRFKVCGMSGDYGFGGIQPYISKTFGVRIKRQVYKKLLKIYFESPLIRKEKLREILDI